VPPDNNGSEKAIRNIKGKQKISGQFKSENGANGFAVIRSIVDTAIKSGQNVLATLAIMLNWGLTSYKFFNEKFHPSPQGIMNKQFRHVLAGWLLSNFIAMIAYYKLFSR